MLQLTLSAVDEELAYAWQQFCGDLDFVTVHHGSMLDLECDAAVSPANSFGFMDGGIDLLYSQYFGWHVQDELQNLIRASYDGELLVGQAVIVPTRHEQIPYLIAAPTMRVPMRLRDSVNPYLAARAALLLARRGKFASGELEGEPVSDYIGSLAFPGLGTGVGGVGANTCAHQVRAAIDDVLLNASEFPSSWAEAQARHQMLYTDRIRDLQRE